VQAWPYGRSARESAGRNRAVGECDAHEREDNRQPSENRCETPQHHADVDRSRWSVQAAAGLDSASRPGPGEEERTTSQGRPYSIFCRALEHGNLLVAEATAKELPPLNLTDALELTMLIARKDPRRHPRVAARWLLRYLEDCDEATIDEAAMVAACLAALSEDRRLDAALTLRAMA
jgi:hypothetical protein